MAVPTPRQDPPKPRTRRRKATDATDATDTRGTRSTRSVPEDAAPNREAAAPPPPPPEVPPLPPPSRAKPPRANSLEARLGEFLGVCSFPFAVAGDNYSAQIIALRSPALATALAELAKENAAIKRVLERVLEGSAWGAVAMASASIVIPICQVHGLIPGNDPFAAIMPAPAPPKPMAWAQPSPNGGSAMGAPAPGSEGDPTRDMKDDDYRPTVPGAPAGVVTVAASGAAHPGT